MPASQATRLDAATFAREHLGPRRPALVRGGLAEWELPPPWPLSWLTERFGGYRAPVYDTLFSLTGVSTFRAYVERFTGDAVERVPPYLRWFARQGPERLPWADEVFAALEGSWSQPSWLPDTDYVFPRTTGRVDAASDPFPAKGLFVCGRGGRTRLHADPWHSDACLCQTTGLKRIAMFAPEDAGVLTSDGAVVDLDEPDEQRFPRWREATPVFDEVLEPGDAVYIPAGWYHSAEALSDSCSITWNFVHAEHAESFERFLESGGGDDPAVSWFLKRA
jgi:hypothetical protein